MAPGLSFTGRVPMQFRSRTDSTLAVPHPPLRGLAILLAAILACAALAASSAQGEEAAEGRSAEIPDVQAFAARHDEVVKLINRGDFEAAEGEAKRVVAMSETAFGKDSPAIVPGLNNLAQVFQQTGRHGEAEALLRRALSLQRQPGADPARAVDVLNRTGSLLSELGRFDEAETATREAIDISERLSSDPGSMLAISLNNLGHILTALRRFDEADAVYARAAGLLGDHAAAAAALSSNLAVQLMGQKRTEEAERLLLKSVAAWEGMEEPVVTAWSTALLNLGRLYYETGRPGEASATFAKVLDLLGGAAQENHPLRAYALQNLSQVAFDRADFPNAEILAREAVAIAGQSLPAMKFEVGDWYQALAQALLLQGKWDEAVEAARQATAILATDLNIRQADKNDWELLAIVEIVASEGMAAGDRADLRDKAVAARRSAFLNLQRHAATDTGAVVAAAAARAAIGRGELSRLVREKDQALARLREVDAAFVRVSGGAENADTRRAALRDLRSELEALQARLSEIDARLLAEFPRYADLAGGAPVPVDRVIGMLADDEILILPVVMDSSLITFAFGSTGGAYVWGRQLADAAELPGLVATLLCQASRQLNPSCARSTEAKSNGGAVPREARGVVAFGGEAGSVSFDLDAAHQAYSLLFPGDLAGVTAGKKLVIAPSPELLGFPWHLLVTRAPAPGWNGPGKDRTDAYRNAAWLFRAHPSITVVPSVAALDASRRSRSAPGGGEGSRYLGVADPVIGTTASERDAAPLPCRNDALPSQAVALSRVVPVRGAAYGSPTAVEAGRLADVDAGRRQPRLADSRCEVEETAISLAGSSDLLLGADATEARIKAMAAEGGLKAYDILHFATHGLVGGELGQAEPGLLLTPPAIASEGDDGVLTSHEIAALDIDADWVILSACNTAAGSRSDAEALAGLARSFFYAGARSLLVSSWPVYSEAATRFTTTVFALLSAQPTLTRGEAVALTMRQMLAESSSPETSHPAYWGPFLLVGDAGR